MKAVRLEDLRDLLESTAFAAWWTEWQRASSAIAEARERRAELVAQSELMALRSELAQRAAADARSRAEEHEAEDRKCRAPRDEALAASFERSLVGAEHGVLAQRARRDAERLLSEAEERRARARRLSVDADAAQREQRGAEARLVALRAAAGEQFGCVAGPSFLYWRHRDDARSALAVSLAEAEGANVSVIPLGIYLVGRERGIAAPEPVRRDGPTTT
jgi:hypothetical protein